MGAKATYGGADEEGFAEEEVGVPYAHAHVEGKVAHEESQRPLEVVHVGGDALLAEVAKEQGQSRVEVVLEGAV